MNNYKKLTNFYIKYIIENIIVELLRIVYDYYFENNSNARNRVFFNSLSYQTVTVDPVYSERVSTAKSVHLRRVFTINIFNLTIN